MALVGRFDNQTVRRQRLEVGDVMLSAPSGTVVIERKSWADLAKSLNASLTNATSSKRLECSASWPVLGVNLCASR